MLRRFSWIIQLHAWILHGGLIGILALACHRVQELPPDLLPWKQVLAVTSMKSPSRMLQREAEYGYRTLIIAGFDELNLHPWLSQRLSIFQICHNNNANDYKQQLCCISFLFTPNYGALKEFTDCSGFLTNWGNSML